MIGWAVQLLAGPLLDAYKARLAAGDNADRLAADLAAKDLAVQQREAELRSAERLALIGHWYEPANLLGYVVVGHFALVVVTNALHGLDIASFSIPEIKGDVAQWMGMVMSFFVGGRAAISVASIFRRR